MKQILLLGPMGQVGWELQRALAPLGRIIAPGRDEAGGNLADLKGLANSVLSLRPEIIVNAAAWTAVDQVESEPDRASVINAHAPATLARVARELGALLVHYSTDYVFDGSGTRAWTEEDPTTPLNVYGRSKLEGEQQILASGCRHLLLRTSWVYASRGRNFLRTILRLATERDALKVVDDQYGAPTSAELIADVTAQALRAVDAEVAEGGLYHLTAGGVTSWHEFASYAIEQARAAGLPIRVRDAAVAPCTTAEYPTPARRPANSRLDSGHLCRAFGLTLPDWKPGVARAVAELAGK